MGAAEQRAFGHWPEYGNATDGGTTTLGQGVIPWDPIALAYLLQPDWFSDERCFEMQLNLKTNPPVCALVDTTQSQCLASGIACPCIGC